MADIDVKQALADGELFVRNGDNVDGISTGTFVQVANLGVVNVKDYGATGDGTTDDTDAIAAAVADAVGKILYFPEGIYLSDPIGAGALAGIIGDGWASIIQLRAQNVSTLGDHAVIEVYGSEGSEIPYILLRDFAVDGNAANMTGTPSLNMECVNLKYVQGGLIENVLCHDSISEGFDLDHSTDVAIIGCVARDCGGNGYHMSNGAVGNRLIGNLADSCGADWNRNGFDQYDGSSPEANKNLYIGCVARDCYRNFKIDGNLAVVTGCVSDGTPTVANSVTASFGGYDPFGVNSITLDINEQTDDYTLVLTDAGKVIEMNKATAVTLTVPTNATVAFPVGTVIEVYAAGAGTVSVAGAVGVTVRNAGDLAAQYATATLRKRDTDEWVLTGAIA